MSDLNDKDLNSRDIETLLGGRAPDGLEPLAGLIERLRREASLPADPATARQHVAAAAAAAREVPEPAAVPVAGSHARQPWRRRTVFAGLISTIIGKVLVGAVALAAATAGAGAAGVLGDPVQDFLNGDQAAERVVEQYRQQLQIQDQEQSGDQQQIRDRDQLGDQTGTTAQQQHQGDQTGTTQQQQQQGDCTGNCGSTTTSGQQQQQQQGQDDEDNATQQQQQQGDCTGACGSTTTDPQQQQQQQGQDDEDNATQQQQQQGDCTGACGSTTTQPPGQGEGSQGAGPADDSGGQGQP